MEYQRHPGEPREQRPEASYHHQQKYEPESRGSGRWWKYLLVLLLIAGVAYGAYYMRDKDAKEQAKKQQSEINTLSSQVSSLTREVAAANKKLADVKEAEPKSPTQATLDNIEAAVKSGNYAALQGLMASKINVIIAASEGVGERTAAQAISDIKYLDTGTDLWNFKLPATTLDDYQAGDYKQYFPETAFVGKSANNYVVSFTFDGNAKISGIFMAANANLL